MATQEQVKILIEAQTQPLLRKIEELTKGLQQVVSVNSITEYPVQTIDDNIRCEESLDVIKSLPTFDGKNSYVSWREAANNTISLYAKGSRKYYAALTILRNKIMDDANDTLTNHGTILNFDAIISRLDFAYADKRPLHIIEQELSIMRQGALSIIDYYNEVNKKLTALINKTIMTHGSDSNLTKELNKKNRQYALRVFITGLNPPLANIIYSLSPTDLPNALAKAQELESNHIRANFALQFNKSHNSGNHINSKQSNTLRFPPCNQKDSRNNFQDRPPQPQPEPMDIGSSANVVQPQKNFGNNYYQQPFRPNFNNGQYFQQKPVQNNFQGYQQNPSSPNGFQQGAKRQPSSNQVSYQPQNKAQRINNLNEEAFLEESPDCPTLSNEEHPEEAIEY